MNTVVKIIGIGKEHRPCAHDTGVWFDQDGICVEFEDGTRKQFYVSQIQFSENIPMILPTEKSESSNDDFVSPIELTQELIELGEAAIDEGLDLRIDGKVQYVTEYMFYAMTDRIPTSYMVHVGESKFDYELIVRTVADHKKIQFPTTVCEEVFKLMVQAAPADFFS